jgi:CspA family cold shock protein
MAAGKLKMWNSTRGFGFIADDAGGPDMFLHVNELKSAGIDPDRIRIGDRLTFDTDRTRDGKTKASNVRVARDPPACRARAQGEEIKWRRSAADGFR